MQASQCYSCVRFKAKTFSCSAYPKRESIPMEIFDNDFIHTKHFKGDNNILFKAIPEDPGANFTKNETCILPAEITAQDKFNDAILYLNRALPALVKDDANYAKIPSGPFRQIDHYPTYTTRWVLGSREVTAKIDIGAAILKKPITVFRDIMEKIDTRQTTVIEEYLGLIKNKAGDPRLVYLLVHRDILIKIRMTDLENRNELINELSGMQLYKRYKNQ